MRTILRLFGRSPFGPTQGHMERVMACVRELAPLCEAACAGDTDRLAAVIQGIDQLEAEADAAKNEIRNHLPKAVFLPVDRGDLLEIVHLQDSMADSLQEAAGMLILKPLAVPASLAEDVRRFTADVLSAAERYAAIMAHLDELLESTFGGPEADRVLEMIDELDAAETKSDVLGRDIVQRLFALEGEIGCLDIMLWYRILERIGEIANYAERAGNRLRLLIARA